METGAPGGWWEEGHERGTGDARGRIKEGPVRRLQLVGVRFIASILNFVCLFYLSTSTQEGQKRVLNPLSWSFRHLWADVGAGNQTQFSARAANTLNGWVTLSSQIIIFCDQLLSEPGYKVPAMKHCCTGWDQVMIPSWEKTRKNKGGHLRIGSPNPVWTKGRGLADQKWREWPGVGGACL